MKTNSRTVEYLSSCELPLPKWVLILMYLAVPVRLLCSRNGICRLVSGSMYSLAKPKSIMWIRCCFFVDERPMRKFSGFTLERSKTHQTLPSRFHSLTLDRWDSSNGHIPCVWSMRREDQQDEWTDDVYQLDSDHQDGFQGKFSITIVKKILQRWTEQFNH